MYTGLFDRVTIHARKDFLGRVVGMGWSCRFLPVCTLRTVCSCYLCVFDTVHLVTICYQTLGGATLWYHSHCRVEDYFIGSYGYGV